MMLTRRKVRPQVRSDEIPLHIEEPPKFRVDKLGKKWAGRYETACPRRRVSLSQVKERDKKQREAQQYPHVRHVPSLLRKQVTSLRPSEGSPPATVLASTPRWMPALGSGLAM